MLRFLIFSILSIFLVLFCLFFLLVVSLFVFLFVSFSPFRTTILPILLLSRLFVCSFICYY